MEYLGHRSTYNVDDNDITTEQRKTYSREEFLHETAATGGPNVAMKIRLDFNNLTLMHNYNNIKCLEKIPTL